MGAAGSFENKVSICPRVLPERGEETGEAGSGHLAAMLILSKELRFLEQGTRRQLGASPLGWSSFLLP